MNTRKKEKNTGQKKAQQKNNTSFLTHLNGLSTNEKHLIRRDKLIRKKAERKKHAVRHQVKQKYYENYHLVKENKNKYAQNKHFLNFIKSYGGYSKLYQQKPPSFAQLCGIATQIQFHATKEDSIYLKEFSRKIFMQMYSMVMSDHPEILETEPAMLVNSIFKLMLDPIRYEVKLQQYARKILFLLTANKCQTTENLDQAAPSLWKLCLLANLHDAYLDFSDLFVQVDELIKDEHESKESYVTISELQNNITNRMKRVLSEQAIKDLMIEYTLGPYIVDIAFPSSKLIVEVDGIVSHHQNKGQRFKDACKDILLSRYGWQVIRIPSYEYHTHRRHDDFEAYIQHKLKDHPSLLRQPSAINEQDFLYHYKPGKKHNPTVFNATVERGKRYSQTINLGLSNSLRYARKIVLMDQNKKSSPQKSKNKSTKTMLLSFEYFPEIVLLTQHGKLQIEKLPIPTKVTSKSIVYPSPSVDAATSKARTQKIKPANNNKMKLKKTKATTASNNSKTQPAKVTKKSKSKKSLAGKSCQFFNGNHSSCRNRDKGKFRHGVSANTPT